MMARPLLRPVAALLLPLMVAPSLRAGAQAATAAEPDWPCVQRLVPSLSASAVWSGPPPPTDESWRRVPQVSALVAEITPSTVQEAKGLRAIQDFVAPLDAQARREMLPMVIAGVLAETNQVRGQVIDRIRAFARRQRGLAETVQRLTEELDATSTRPGSGAEAAARRAEMEQHVFFATKTFQDAERTVRYMCEVPVRLDGRFGAYARALQAALPPTP